MKTELLILGVIIVVAIVAGGYYVLSGAKGSSVPSSTASYTSLPASTTAPSTTVTSGSSGNTTSTAPSTTINASGGKAYSVKIAYNSTVGYYLESNAGLTLYYFKIDKPNTSTSACNSGCSGTWIPFYNSTLSLPSSLVASNFNTITRSDGRMQLAYKGYPLYHYVGDNAAGQLNGEGLGGLWYAVAAPNATQ